MNTKQRSIKNILVCALSLVVILGAGLGQASAVDDPGGGGSPNPSPTPTTTPGAAPKPAVTPCVGTANQCVPETGDPALTNCKTQDDCNLVKKYLNPFIKFLGIMVGIAITIGIIVGGIQYASSGGDPQKAAAAKLRIRNSILALIIYIFLYAFLRFLSPGTFA